MNISNQVQLLRFSKDLAGEYSNKRQAQENPRCFAHINIYFQPLPWEIFQGPGFYSEQSYDYAPWSPYRQGLHQLSKKNKIFILHNYALKNAEKFAGSGSHPELLSTLNINEARERVGCAMIFQEVSTGNYKGQVEPGASCLIPRGGKMTYLQSQVEFNCKEWIGIDEGFDVCTKKKIWGSEHGPLRFEKILNLGQDLENKWVMTR